MVATDKKVLRSEVKRKTLSMGQAERDTEAQRVVAQLECCLTEREVGVLAMFYPLPDEIDVLPIAERAKASGWRVVMPRMASGEEAEMEFYDFSEEQMAEGKLGVLEPQMGDPIGVEEIDLMVVPAVAFTADGARLGRGKGYYDRYMARSGFRAYTIGVGYAHQILSDLPQEAHDRRVDRVIGGKE